MAATVPDGEERVGDRRPVEGSHRAVLDRGACARGTKGERKNQRDTKRGDNETRRSGTHGAPSVGFARVFAAAVGKPLWALARHRNDRPVRSRGWVTPRPSDRSDR